MKWFGKKRKKTSYTRVAAGRSPSFTDSFYERPSEPSLPGTRLTGGDHRYRRTSLNPGGKRESGDNRASDLALLKLVFKGILVLAVISGALFGIRVLVNRLGEPSERKKQAWAEAASRMQKELDGIPAQMDGRLKELDSGTDLVTAETMENRMERWALAERHFRTAEALARRNDVEAVERLNQALRANPDHHAAQQLLQEILYRSGNYADLIPVSLRLLDLDSRSWTGKTRLLVALRETGQTDAGLILALNMLEAQSNDLLALETAAGFYYTQGRIDEAALFFSRILANHRSHVPALRSMAAIASGRQDWIEAEKYYQELLRVAPDEDTYYALAICYGYLNRPDSVVSLLTQAVSLFGNAPVAVWVRNAGFDAIREVPEFQSLTDRLVGVEARRAIEDIRRREAEAARPEMPKPFELPRQPDLKAIQPGR